MIDAFEVWVTVLVVVAILLMLLGGTWVYYSRLYALLEARLDYVNDRVAVLRGTQVSQDQVDRVLDDLQADMGHLRRQQDEQAAWLAAKELLDDGVPMVAHKDLRDPARKEPPSLNDPF